MKKFYLKSKILVGAAATTAMLLTGCGNSENFVFTNGQVVAPIPAPPVAVNDAFNALGNATVNYSAANGVLINDTLNGADISAFDAVGSQGGSLVLNNDGSFDYTPVFGFVGAETFNYTLSNADGDSTATITLTSTGEGFFVNNQAAPGGNGSQASPFDTLAAAITAAGTGDTIFVSRGDGTSTGLAGAFTLPAGVDLIGEGQGLILTQTIVPQGQAPVLTGPITCGGDNTISGIIFDGENTQPQNIDIDVVSDVTVSNNTFRNATFRYITCNDASGTISIDNNQFDPGDSMTNYIEVDNTDTNGTFSITNNTFDDDNTVDPDCEAVEFDIEGTTNMTLTFTGNSVNGDGSSGNSFTDGIEIDCDGTSTVTFTIDTNTFTALDQDGVDVDTENSGASSSGSVSGNIISDVGEDAMDVEVSGGTTTLSNNIIDNPVDEGVEFDFASQGGTIIATGNQITNAGDNGIDYSDSTAATPVSIALRNNTVTDATTNAVDLGIFNAVSACADITGNIVNGNMVFDDQSTGTFEVEEFANLTTINTFNAGSPQEPNDAVVPVADGFCAIP